MRVIKPPEEVREDVNCRSSDVNANKSNDVLIYPALSSLSPINGSFLLSRCNVISSSAHGGLYGSNFSPPCGSLHVLVLRLHGSPAEWAENMAYTRQSTRADPKLPPPPPLDIRKPPSHGRHVPDFPLPYPRTRFPTRSRYSHMQTQKPRTPSQAPIR